MTKIAYLASRVTIPGSLVRRTDAFEHDFMMDALRAPFAERGMTVEDISWDDPKADWASYSAVLIGTTIVFGEKRFGLAGLRDLAADATRNIVNIVAILAGVGFIVGSLSYTGVGGAFSRELLQFANGDIYLLLILGALTSFILGMGMTASACYIFLAITLGPALIGGGLNPIGAHLFILYWGLISFITPPVALAAIAAARSDQKSAGDATVNRSR